MFREDRNTCCEYVEIGSEDALCLSFPFTSSKVGFPTQTRRSDHAQRGSDHVEVAVRV